jgi:SnoaL-like protein
MSQENVEIVRALIGAPGVNLADALRSDEQFDVLRKLARPVICEDFECYASVVGTQERYEGIDGLRELWLTWVEPWASYRTETEALIDLDDRVLALVRDFGRRDGMTDEVMLIGATIWTFEGGKIKRATFYVNRNDALEAAGLSE